MLCRKFISLPLYIDNFHGNSHTSYMYSCCIFSRHISRYSLIHYNSSLFVLTSFIYSVTISSSVRRIRKETISQCQSQCCLIESRYEKYSLQLSCNNMHRYMLSMSSINGSIFQRITKNMWSQRYYFFRRWKLRITMNIRHIRK